MLSRESRKIITREELRGYCKTLNLSYNSAITYLLSNKYLVRLFRGIFYIMTLEERRKKLANISFYEAISEALKTKGVKNWYFGLETGLKFNNLTHEYFATDYIISDTIKRPRPINILGHKVRFLKIKKRLVDIGIEKGSTPYSDTEKTILDIIYFSIYNGRSEEKIKNNIIDYMNICDKKKLEKYSRFYPKSILKFLGEK